jgi:elongation factor G
MSGMGELHLEILVDRMQRDMGMQINVGKPQVAFKETISGPADAEAKYIKQTGGHGQYGHCFIKVEPLARGEGFKFLNKVKGGAIPSEFIPSVEKGVIEALEKGVLLGYPMTDIQVTLYDGSYHDVDSSDIAFKIAGSMALQDAAKKAGIALLEPVMKLEVTVPEEFMGVSIGDISSKRGKILGTDKRGKAAVIRAYAPLAELSGYITILRSLTEGRGVAYMEPSHYEEVPQNIVRSMTEK